MTLLHLENIGYTTSTGATLVQNISLQASAGEFIALMGPNGAGKTTLLKLISGLLHPSHGTLDIQQKPLTSYAPLERARQISYLEQLGNIAWSLPCEQVIALGRFPHGASPGRLREADKEILENVTTVTETKAFLHRDIHTLSGGERARVLLARALAVQAPVLLVDEPTASLDPHHQLHIMEVLQQTAASGTLVIAAMHDLTLATEHASRMVVLSNGNKVADDTPISVLKGDAIGTAYGIRTQQLEVEGRKVVVTLSRT